MRVVHVATIDSSIRYLLLDQLRYLASRGHDVHAICAPGPHVRGIERAGIRVHVAPLTRRVTPGRDAKALWSITRLLRSLRPDLLHTHTPKASLLGQHAALLANVPFRVHTIHGLYVPAGACGLRRRAFLALERLTMRPADVVLSQSAEDIVTCQRYALYPADRLRYLGNGIDVERFSQPGLDDRARAMLGRQAREVAIRTFDQRAVFARVEKAYAEVSRASPQEGPH